MADVDGRSDVLIVGAGPSGMVAAVLLAQLGVTVRIVERHPSRLRFPKAHVVNPVTLDICARAGFAIPAMVAAAIPPDLDRYGRFRVHLLGEEIGAIPFERQPSSWVPRPRINLAQPRFESILEWKLQVLPGIDYRAGRWLDLRRDGKSIISVVADSAGESRYESRFVIAADGAASPVRQALGIGTTAYGPGRDRISVHIAADFSPWLASRPAGIYWVVDPQARGTFIAHDIEDEWVYVFDPAGPETRTADHIEARVRKAIGSDVPFAILGISPWVMACEVADRFAVDDVFLVGDAAHQLPPTGGLGMNTGIQDAENLAWKLAAVVHGWAGDAVLESYSSERRPIGVVNALQSLSNAAAMQTLYATLGAAIATDSLDTLPAEQVALLLDAQWDHLNSPALQFGYTYKTDDLAMASTGRYAPSGAEGHRLPHTWTDHDGKPVAIVDRISLSSFTLVANGAAARYEELAQHAAIPVEIVDVAGAAPSDWLHLVGIATVGSGVMVRPDTHIIGRCAAPTSNEWTAVHRSLVAYVNGQTAQER